MKKWKKPWHLVPRGARIVINFLLIALLLVFSYVAWGGPLFTGKQAYYRAARNNMVGPGTILDTLKLHSGSAFDRLLLAKTEEGVILYNYFQEKLGLFTYGGGRFIYRERGAHVTLVTSGWAMYANTLPIILFDEYPQAVSAELYLRLYDEVSAEQGDVPEFDYAYHLTASREGEGYFVFLLECGGDPLSEKEFQALNAFVNVAGEGYGADVRRTFPAVVRLYDEQGGLVYEEELTLRSISAEAHDKHTT